MSDLPKSWKWTSISDIAEIASGVGFPRDHQGQEAGDYPFAKVSDISRAVREEDGQLSRASNYINEEDLKTLRAKPVPEGATVFAKIGEALRLNRRAITTQQTVLDNNCMALIPRTDKVDPVFLYRFMNTVDLSPYAVATAVPSVRRSDVAEISFPLPPVPEQRRIVAKLDNVFAKSKAAREELERVPKLVDRYKQAVLTAAFRGELTAEWRADRSQSAGLILRRHLLGNKTESALSRKMKPRKEDESVITVPDELPILPSSWTWMSVDELSTRVSDGVHKKPEYAASGVPFLTVRNLTAGDGISFEGCRFVTQRDHEEFIKRTNPEAGDILISKDGTLGEVRAVRTNRQFSIFVSVALIKPIDKNMTDYLELALRSPLLQKQMAGVGTGLQHIHLTDLRRDLVPIAPEEERAEIVRCINEKFALIDRAAAQQRKAAPLVARFEQAILAKAFSGGL